MRNVYLALTIVGFLWPVAEFYPFLAERGIDLAGFWKACWSGAVASTFTADFLISSLVFAVFAFTEGKRLGLRLWWAPVVANVTLGLSVGFPLFLAMREPRRAA